MLNIITSYPTYHLLFSLLIVFLFIGFKLQIVNFQNYYFVLVFDKATCHLFCLKGTNIMWQLFQLTLQILA